MILQILKELFLVILKPWSGHLFPDVEVLNFKNPGETLENSQLIKRPSKCAKGWKSKNVSRLKYG